MIISTTIKTAQKNKKRKPHQLFHQKTNYLAHLKRIQNLMSDQSPTAKKNKKERIHLIKMINNSRKIHENSIKYQFSLRKEKQNQFKSNANFHHVKSVVRDDLSKSRHKNQPSQKSSNNNNLMNSQKQHQEHQEHRLTSKKNEFSFTNANLNKTKRYPHKHYVVEKQSIKHQEPSSNLQTSKHMKKQKSEGTLNHFLKDCFNTNINNNNYNNSSNNSNIKVKSVLNTQRSHKINKLLPLKVRLQQKRVEQENQRLVDRLLKVKPQISFPITQRKHVKHQNYLQKGKNKNFQSKLLSKNLKIQIPNLDINNTKLDKEDQQKQTPNQALKQPFLDTKQWKSVLLKTDNLKIYQSSKINQSNTQKDKIVFKLAKNSNKLSKKSPSNNRNSTNNDNKIVSGLSSPNNNSVKQSLNDSIIYQTQKQIIINPHKRTKKLVIRFNQNFFKTAKISKMERKQFYMIQIQNGTQYFSKSQPAILEDLIDSQIIILIPYYSFGRLGSSQRLVDKENNIITSLSQSEDLLYINFYKILENKSIFKGQLHFSEKDLISSYEKTSIINKKKTCLTNRTNATNLFNNSKMKQDEPFDKIQKDFFFTNGKKSFQTLTLNIRCTIGKGNNKKKINSKTGIVAINHQHLEI